MTSPANHIAINQEDITNWEEAEALILEMGDQVDELLAACDEEEVDDFEMALNDIKERVKLLERFLQALSK